MLGELMLQEESSTNDRWQFLGRENSEVCSTPSPRDFQCIESHFLTGVNYSITQVTLVSLFPVSLLFLLVLPGNHFSNKPPALQPCLKVCF